MARDEKSWVEQEREREQRAMAKQRKKDGIDSPSSVSSKQDDKYSGRNFYDETMARLNRSEDDSATGSSKDADSADSNSKASAKENDINYTGAKGDSGKGKKKGLAKKFGPMGAIIALLFGASMGFFSFNSILPIHISELIKGNFDTQHTSMSLRSQRMTTFLMENRPVKTGFLSRGKAKYRGFSTKQIKNLSQRGIDVMIRDSSGNLVVATKKVGTGETMALRHRSLNVETGEVTVKNIAAADFQTAFDSDKTFKYAYAGGTRAIGSRVTGWFDGIAAKALGEFKITRKLFSAFIEETNGMNAKNQVEIGKMMNTEINNKIGVSASIDNDQKYASRTEQSDDGEGGTTSNRIEQQVGEQKFDDPEAINSSKPVKEEFGDRLGDTKPSADIRNAKIIGAAEKVSSLANVGQMVTNLACAGIQIYNGINLIVTATKMFQVKNYAAMGLEAGDRQKTGDTNQHLVSEWGDRLATKVPDEVVTSSQGDGKDAKLTQLDKVRSATESEGLNYLLTGSKPNKRDPVLRQFALEDATTADELYNMPIDVSTTTSQKLEVCTVAKGALAVVSMVADITIAIASGGLSLIFKGFAKRAAIGAAAYAAGHIIGLLMPMIGAALAGELINSFTLGAPVGEAMTMGGHNYTSDIGRAGAEMPGGKTEVMQYRQETKKVLALDAELDRQRRSPFDATSPNTFLGSLYLRVLPILSSFSSISSVMSSVSTVASNSLASILPTASAVDDANFTNFIGNCPELESVGVIGDIYCEPFMTSDLSTAQYDQDTIVDRIVENSIQSKDSSGNITASYDLEEDGDGNIKIKQGGDLAKFIDYCTERESRFGVYDNSIAEDFKPIENGVADALVGIIPIAGDAVELAGSIDQSLNKDWINGQRCVNNPSANDKWNGQISNYQAFVQNSRILEEISYVDKSPVTAYIEERNAIRPRDNSFEGYIARAAGMTKDDAEFYLAVIQELANPTVVATGTGPVINETIEYLSSSSVLLQSDEVNVKTNISISTIRRYNFENYYHEQLVTA
jgi:hypothetical protein